MLENARSLPAEGLFLLSVPNETWTLDIDHSILGAYTLFDEGVDGGGIAEFTSPGVSASCDVGGGPVPLDFVPNLTSVVHSISNSPNDSNVEFSGSNGVALNGSANTHVALDFSFAPRTMSDSNVAFPALQGDEVAIRFGENDTQQNGFTAGRYPGPGGAQHLRRRARAERDPDHHAGALAGSRRAPAPHADPA